MTSSDTMESTLAAQRWNPPQLLWSEPLTKAPEPPTAEALQRIEAAAFEEGYLRGQQEGHKAGYSAGQQQVCDDAQRLRELCEHIARPLAELDTEVERMLVALTIEVARRLVGAQLELNPELTASAVHEAVAALASPPREARVHLHPADAVLLEKNLAPAEGGTWRVVSDATLRRGDCRVVTDGAQVDALLDTREAGIARALLGEAE